MNRDRSRLYVWKNKLSGVFKCTSHALLTSSLHFEETQVHMRSKTGPVDPQTHRHSSPCSIERGAQKSSMINWLSEKPAPTMKYSRLVSNPMMLPRQNVAGEKWFKEKVTWTGSDWFIFVWSHGKKIKWGGSDGFGNSWHDIPTEKRLLSKKQQWCDSVMVWDAFAGTTKSERAVLEWKKDSWKYINTLES